MSLPVFSFFAIVMMHCTPYLGVIDVCITLMVSHSLVADKENPFYIYKLQNVYNYVRIMCKESEVHFMPQIRPITDLRNTNDISDACHAVKEPIFITKNGYGDLVVMSIETYEQIVETQAIDNAISEAEEEYDATGILLDAKETLASLRRKHFG